MTLTLRLWPARLDVFCCYTMIRKGRASHAAKGATANYFARLTHPANISKNPGFRALYLARQNEFLFSFNKYKRIYFFSFLAAGFCPINLVFARKITFFPEYGAPSPLARTPMLHDSEFVTESNLAYVKARTTLLRSVVWICCTLVVQKNPNPQQIKVWALLCTSP